MGDGDDADRVRVDEINEAVGVALDTNGSDDATNWVIYKFTYSGTDATRIQKANGSWTNRASLF